MSSTPAPGSPGRHGGRQAASGPYGAARPREAAGSAVVAPLAVGRSILGGGGAAPPVAPKNPNSLAKKGRLCQRILERQRCSAQIREVELISSSKQFYDPVTLSVMASAFDGAHDFLRTQFGDNDHMRRKLAMHIIREVDSGESDPRRLAKSAILSILNITTRRVP